MLDSTSPESFFDRAAFLPILLVGHGGNILELGARLVSLRGQALQPPLWLEDVLVFEEGDRRALFAATNGWEGRATLMRGDRASLEVDVHGVWAPAGLLLTIMVDVQELLDTHERKSAVVHARTNAVAHELAELKLQRTREGRQFSIALDELTEQQEEIQAQNDELHGQAEELRAQAEELAIQRVRLVEADVQRVELLALRHLDTLKDQFLGVVSHELRTPINAITGFGSILEDGLAGPLSDRQHGYLQKMLGGCDRLLSLINDLIDMSHILADRYTPDARPTDLAMVAKGALGRLRPLLAGKALEVEWDLPPALPLVRADALQAGGILDKLLSNAIKFTPAGGRIVLSARVVGDVVRCEVSDTGVGVAEVAIQKLFTPFSQANMATTRSYGGLGLGLSIAKGLIEAHGGNLVITSDGVSGTTVAFTLALA